MLCFPASRWCPPCSYVSARGMEPLSSVEWEVYKQHALAEFSVMREANEEELREAGHSTFFNSKVDSRVEGEGQSRVQVPP